MFNEILQDAFIDTVKMVPLLLVIYIGIEIIEYKYSGAILAKIKKAGIYGPLAGALAGIFPQCGFSVIATALYTQKLVTVGTLLAVYLSTSDEALPIILSQPEKIGIVLPLILTKIIIALIAGYVIDFAFKQGNKKILAHAADYSQGTDDKNHHHETILEERACCGHSASAASKKFNPKEIFFHPLIHTLKIFIFIFGASLAINFFVDQLGDKAIMEFFTANIFWSTFLAALIGLIPNCAASVVITQLYLDNLIAYGAAIAGLCASGGLGILVLLKEEKSKKNAAMIIGLLFLISIIAGIIIQLFV
jgi:hypothetical protein